MGGKAKAPAAPDPVQLANAQANANTQTAQQQQKLNMVNTEGPSGSVSYVADPTAPGGYKQVTSLTPQEQANYNAQTGVYGSALQTAQDQIGRVNQALGQGLNTEGLPALQGFDPATAQRYEDAAYQSATRRLDPQFQRMESGLDAKLAAQGLGANSAASQNLRQDFARDRTDAYGAAQNAALQQGLQSAIAGGTFGNQARTQGLQERAYMQNQPIQQLQALLGTGEVGTPQGVQYTPTSVGQTDVLGANALSQQAQWNKYNAKSQQQSGLMNGLFQLGSAAIMSDRRLKRDIEQIGTLDNGLPVYSYRYIWGRKRHVGVMAQDVIRAGIDAVIRHWSGFYMVDYGKLA